MIAAPCAPSACHGVEIGHAMRQPALIARPAPAPYRAPVTGGRVASEFRNIRLNSRTRIPPAKKAGVSAHTRSAQMGNTVDVNENEYAVATFEEKLAAVRKMESDVIQSRRREQQL